MDVVSLALSKGYTNEKIIEYRNNNLPTKTVSFDGGIYSVGSDVVEGQVSDIVVKGRTYTNILGSDGDFEIDSNEDGIADGWSGYGTLSSKSLANGGIIGSKYQKFTVEGTALGVQKTISLVADHVYFISAYVKTTAGSAALRLYAGGTFKAIVGATNSTTFTRIKALYTADGTETTLRACSNTSDAMTLGFDGVQVVDLTAIGDNETNLDVLANKYPYVDGTKSTNSVRLKFVGKNLFDIGKATVDSGLAWASGSLYHSVNAIASDFIPVVIGKSYASKYKMQVILFDANKKYLRAYNDAEAPIFSFAISGGNNASYVRIAFRSMDNNNLVMKEADDLQLEQSSTATEYEPYKESSVTINLPEPLRSVPSAKDEFNVTTGVKTQRNGTKTNVNSGTVINYADMATGGQFVAYAADGTSQVGVKGDTLTITAVSLTYQLATPIVTKLPAQAPLQVYENGTVYVEPVGDPSETTLPSVELTVPIGDGNKVGIATHDYAGATADWILTSNESKCTLLHATNAGGAANIIAPDRPGLMFVINNQSGQAITIKKSGGTGVTVTASKRVTVMHLGTDYVAITAEV